MKAEVLDREMANHLHWTQKLSMDQRVLRVRREGHDILIDQGRVPVPGVHQNQINKWFIEIKIGFKY